MLKQGYVDEREEGFRLNLQCLFEQSDRATMERLQWSWHLTRKSLD